MKHEKGEKPEKGFKTSDELIQDSKYIKKRNKKEGKEFGSNKERLEALLSMMEDAIGITEGLFRLRPGSSQVYALTNLVTQAQGLMSQLDQSYNFADIAHTILVEAIDPIVEQLLIQLSQSLGQIPKDIENIDINTRTVLKNAISQSLKDFANNVQQSREEIEDTILDILREE